MSEVVRRFKAVAIREESETGIGIVEYEPSGETISLDSVYYPSRLSNRDTYVNTIKRIEMVTQLNEVVVLRTSSMQSKPKWRRHFTNVRGKSEWFKAEAFGECLDLAKDGIKRKTTVYEHL